VRERIGIFGETECGKTFVAMRISAAFWKNRGTPSLVLDPWLDQWGQHAWVTSSQDQFVAAVAKREHCLVIVDDTSATIQRSKEFIPFFTAIRHHEHSLCVCGHDGSDLLPIMRRQINDLYLFTQTEKSVELWQADQPSMQRLELAATPGFLKQYEFIRCRKNQTAEGPLKLRL
jgi:hypothetical protein